jgi:hypothetical protein
VGSQEGGELIGSADTREGGRMSKRFTAKVVVESKVESPGGTAGIRFRPDYEGGRNAEWADATPALSLALTVKADVAEGLEVGDAYTLTFAKD